MDFNFVQIIVFIVIFFRVVRFFNGMRPKDKKKNSGSSIFDTIQKQLKDLENSIETVPTPVESTRTKPIPIPELKENNQQEYARPTYQPATSMEITEAPYSNLEEGIIDSVHASKFNHHSSKKVNPNDSSEFIYNDTSDFVHRDITDDEVGKERIVIKKRLLEDFDPKKAFIHSLIFERKHFDV